jgi:hypothetical protein
MVDKVALGQVFSPTTSVSPDNLHSTNFSTITIWGWYKRPVVAAVPKVPPHKSGLSLHKRKLPCTDIPAELPHISKPLN